MKPVSVEESLDVPTKQSIGRQIAKNLHIAVPMVLVSVLAVVLLFHAQQEEVADEGKTENTIADNIKGRSQIELAAPPQVLLDEIAAQRKAVEDMQARKQPQHDGLPPLPPGAAANLPPGVAASLPPVPSGTPRSQSSEDLQREQLRAEQIRQSPIIAARGTSAAANAARERAPVESEQGPSGMPKSSNEKINALRAEAERARKEGMAQKSQIIAASMASHGEGRGAGDRPQVVAGANAGAGATGNPNERWLQGQQGTRGATITATSGSSPYTIHQNTIIPGVLQTDLNSDMPGQIAALVTMDVYDSIRGTALIIPKGSRLVGRYNSDVRVGQERIMVAFERIIRPDGSSIDLGAMAGTDGMGASGLPGEVNNHFFKMFSSSLMIAAISWAFDRQAGDTVVVNNTTQSPQQGTGEILQDISRSVLERNTRIPPTITVPRGERLNIIVSRDISIPPYAAR